jgi:PAS domain S-box-containing protein
MLHQIFHASPSPIAINRLSDGTFLDVNEEWSSFFGYNIEEVYGRSFSDLGIWARGERQQEYMRRLREQFSVHEFEIDVLTCSGESKTVVCSSQIIEVEGEQCVLTVMNDITEHKRTRNALKESEERFRMMADSAPVLIWVADESGECIYFNKPWLEFTGRSLEEDEGKGWHQNVHPDDFDSFRSNYARALENRETFSTEYRLRRHDGEYRWVLDRGIPRYNADGSFAGFIGSVIDINEQKDTEQKMLEAKEHAEEMAKLKSTFLTNMTHEIRTPLTVILGFTSILRQGVRPEYHRFVNLIDRSGRRLLLMLDSMLDLAQLEAGTLEIERTPRA